jgi:hypothetical protein
MVMSMPKSDQSETDRRGLLLLAGPATQHPSLARSVPTAAFVSQLIAARDRLSPQRTRRLETSAGAVGAYGRGAVIADRRMPMGYRKTKVV